jgi:predicted Zn finger-like uncharacterized protein
MLITCPNCATSYDVKAASLGEGRSVKCVRCHEVWFATPAEAAPAPAVAVDEPAPEPPADDFAHHDDAADVDAARAHASDDDPAADTGDALDAHDAPPLAPGAGEDAAADADEPSEDIESSAARRARHDAVGGRRIRPSRLATVILALVAANAVLLGWRSDVVRLMPQTASLFAAIGLPVNLRGLAFSDVTTSSEMSEGVPVLLVKGRITNLTRQPHDVPRLRFALRNNAGNEVYAWTSLPSRPHLAPGETQPFETRLASPPADGQAVIVRFFNRRDATGGGR